MRENVIDRLNEDEKPKVKRTKVGRSLIWALCLTLLGLGIAGGAALRRKPSQNQPARAADVAVAVADGKPSRPLGVGGVPLPQWAADYAAGKTPRAHEAVSEGEPAEAAPLGPREQVEEVMKQLHASGNSSEPWTAQAARLVGVWAQETPPALRDRVQLGAMECFHDGCVTMATYADASAYSDFDRFFPFSDAFSGWPGIKHRTGPAADPDGKMHAAWVFFRPTEL